MKGKRMVSLKRFAVSMLALIMMLTYMPILSGAAYAGDEDKIELTPEQAEAQGIEVDEDCAKVVVSNVNPDVTDAEIASIVKPEDEIEFVEDDDDALKLDGSSNEVNTDTFQEDHEKFGALTEEQLAGAVAIQEEELGSQLACAISEGSIVTYQFTATQDHAYYFTSSDVDTNVDPLARVLAYDPEKEQYRQIVHDDDGAGTGNNFRISFMAKQGETYILQATDYYRERTGNYNVTLGLENFEASLDVSFDKATATLTASGTVKGDTFYDLYVDDERCDAGIDGETEFNTTVNMKDYPVGYHVISARLNDSNASIKYDTPIPTLVYSQKPVLYMKDFYSAPKFFGLYYSGKSYKYDSGCGVYYDYKKKGGSWKKGYGPLSTNSSLRNIPSRKLKPRKSYVVRAYFGWKGKVNGKPVFIKGPVSKSKTVKTASNKKLSIKKVTTTKAKVKYWYTLTTYNSWGYMISRRAIYLTSFKVTIRLKKKPGTTGIYLGNVRMKGNKKKYRSKTISLSGGKKEYKGKKIKGSFYSYQSTSYGGYSPTVKKKFKIR